MAIIGLDKFVDFFIVFSDLGINTTMEQELNAIREIYLR